MATNIWANILSGLLCRLFIISKYCPNTKYWFKHVDTDHAPHQYIGLACLFANLGNILFIFYFPNMLVTKSNKTTCWLANNGILPILRISIFLKLTLSDFFFFFLQPTLPHIFHWYPQKGGYILFLWKIPTLCLSETIARFASALSFTLSNEVKQNH